MSSEKKMKNIDVLIKNLKEAATWSSGETLDGTDNLDFRKPVFVP